jgi:hypothetical protein
MLKKICEKCNGTGKVSNPNSCAIPIWGKLITVEVISIREITNEEAYEEGVRFIKLMAEYSHGKFFDGMCNEIKKNHPANAFHN